MFASLEILNSFDSDIFMDDIPDMICQLQYLYLQKYFIQRKN